MPPDSDVKDRIDRPVQKAVPDTGVYAGPVAEDDDDEGDGDGEGCASFAPAVLDLAGGRPWDDVSLSAAERMAMMKVLRTNFPDVQSRAAREEFEFRIRARTAKAAAGSIRLVIPPEPFIREYGRGEEFDRKDIGLGAIIGMPPALAMLNMKAKPEANRPSANYLGLAEIVANQMPVPAEAQSEARAGVARTPKILSRDTGFVQALMMIYEAMAPETLMKIAPGREARWSDKRLEQKENLADITVKAPETPPGPATLPRDEMNIGVPALK